MSINIHTEHPSSYMPGAFPLPPSPLPGNFSMFPYSVIVPNVGPRSTPTPKKRGFKNLPPTFAKLTNDTKDVRGSSNYQECPRSDGSKADFPTETGSTSVRAQLESFAPNESEARIEKLAMAFYASNMQSIEATFLLRERLETLESRLMKTESDLEHTLKQVADLDFRNDLLQRELNSMSQRVETYYTAGEESYDMEIDDGFETE